MCTACKTPIAAYVILDKVFGYVVFCIACFLVDYMNAMISIKVLDNVLG